MTEATWIMTIISPVNMSVKNDSQDGITNHLLHQEGMDSQFDYLVSNGAFFPQQRGFGLLGVIGGFALLIIFLAFITCVRHRQLFEV